MDSGADINVITRDVTEKLDMKIFREPHPYHIKFGQGEKVLVSEYILGNGLVDKVAIADGINANLFNIRQFTARNMHVIFTIDKVKVLYRGKIVISGQLSHGTSLYVFDMKELLAAPAVSTHLDDEKSFDNDMDDQRIHDLIENEDESVGTCLVTTKTRQRYNQQHIRSVK